MLIDVLLVICGRRLESVAVGTAAALLAQNYFIDPRTDSMTYSFDWLGTFLLGGRLACSHSACYSCVVYKVISSKRSLCLLCWYAYVSK